VERNKKGQFSLPLIVRYWITSFLAKSSIFSLKTKPIAEGGTGKFTVHYVAPLFKKPTVKWALFYKISYI